MDYHCYSSIGVGSVPPLITGPSTLGGSGLPDHSGPPGTGPPPPPPSIPGNPSSLLAPHHAPLMFHYGVGGKPHNVPPHLLPTVSVVNAVASSIGNTNCNTNSINKNGTTLLYSKASGSGVGRTTVTVPPLGITSSIPPTTTVVSARSSSPNSSFAAALRSLAKQATGPPGSEAEVPGRDSNSRTPPKTVQAVLPATSTGPSVSVASAPPIVTVAPTHTHLSLPEIRKPVEGFAEMERVGPEDIVRGFQPYRAPELPSVSAANAVAQAPLRPTHPLELAHAYPPYPSLYSHHLSHQYRLEEQLYLERYGLIRPPLGPYGVGGLSALYPASPYLTARFPPELLPTSLAALHPSSALLHERLKLEEDIRQREYELELRRERELEREREKERERGREREREREKEKEREREKEKEREKRHKEYHENEKMMKEERLKGIENIRDRSPLSHAVSGLWNNVNSTTSPLPKKTIATGNVSQLGVRTSDSRASKSATDVIQGSSGRDSTVLKIDPNAPRLDGGIKHRTPAIVRPFETTSVNTPVNASPAFITSLSSSIEEAEKKTEAKFSHTEKRPSVSAESLVQSDISKPFTVWQPVQLNSTSSSSTVTTTAGRTQATLPPPLIMSSIPVTYSEGCLPSSSSLGTPNVSHTKTFAIQSLSNALSQNCEASKSNQTSVQSPYPPVSVSFSHIPAIFPESIPYVPHSSQATTIPAPVPLPTLSSAPVSSIPPPPVPVSTIIPAPGPPVPISAPPISAPTPTCTNLVSAPTPVFTPAPSLPASVSSLIPVPTLVPSSTPSHGLPPNVPSLPPHLHVTQDWRSFLSPALHNTTLSSTVQSSVAGSLEVIPVVTATQPSLPLETVNVVSSPHVSSVARLTTVTSQGYPVSSNIVKTPEDPPEILLKPSPVLAASISVEPSESSPTVKVPSPLEKSFTPVSRLDTEEQRLRELRAMGMLAAEAEETLLEEALSPTKSTGVLCIKGPPNPLDASSEKLSFLCSFGLTTHDKADEVELGRYERRAKVLTPLSSSPRKDPTSPNGCISAGKLAPMLAPGQNLPEACKIKNSSLLVDFSNKSRFLHHLDLQPQHSLSKQKEVERIWKLIIEERLRRYCQNDSDDPLAHKICSALKKLLEFQLPTPPPSPLSTQKESSKNVSSSDSSPLSASASASSSTKLIPTASIQTLAPSSSPAHSMGTLLLVQQLQDPTTSSTIWGLPLSTTSVTSSAQIRSSLVKLGMKGMLEDGVLGIDNFVQSDHDPISGLSGFEKMIDHFLKNAQAEDGNDKSRLLEHIKEVRRCQMSVCQSAQIVQDQVAKLISSRSQLESHRAALHHHLASISTILASKNSQPNSAPGSTQVTITTTTSSTTCIDVASPSTSSVSASLQSKSVSNGIASSNHHFLPLSSFHPPLYSMSTIQSSLQSGTSSTNMFSTVTQQPPPPANPHGMSTASSNLPIPALVPLTTKGPQSALPAATVVSWAGISPPFIAGTNIPLSGEGKDTVFYPNLISRDQSSQPSTTQIQLKINPKLTTFNVSPNASGLLKSTSSTSNRNAGNMKSITVKSHSNYLQSQLTSKFNGSTASLSQRNAFKPLQQTGTSASSSTTKSVSNLNVITCSTFPASVGALSLPHSSQPSLLNLPPTSAGSNPTSSSAFLGSKGPTLYTNHSSSLKSHKSSKSSVGFSPYSKSPPSKLQTWFPN